MRAAAGHFFLYHAPRTGWGGSSVTVGADGGWISGGSSDDRLCLMRAWLSAVSRSASSELVRRVQLSPIGKNYLLQTYEFPLFAVNIRICSPIIFFIIRHTF
jgi:hypothetical protein